MQIKCTQCGASIPIEHDSEFIKCPYCDTSLYLDTDRTVKHYYLDLQVGERDLGAVIQRTLSYMEVVQPVSVKNSEAFYFPFWRFDLASGGTLLVPAATPPVEALEEAKMPAGDLRLMKPGLAAHDEVIEPEVLLEDAARQGIGTLGDEKTKFSCAALVHLPMYAVHYECDGKDWNAVVDGVSGAAYADEWPPAPQKQKDRVLGLIAAVTFLVFLVEAAAIPGFWPVLPAYAVTAAGIYLVARRVLRGMGW